jgi:aspartate dehydrogenase
LSPDVVIEAASQQAVREYGLRVLEAGCDLIVMSVGALMDKKLLEQLMDMARRTRRRIYIPSGAIAGLEAVYALSLNGIREVRLRTRKPPKSLADAPYVKEKGINLDNIKEPTKIYEGPAGEAVKYFPANVNVAAALSLAAKREAISCSHHNISYCFCKLFSFDSILFSFDMLNFRPFIMSSHKLPLIKFCDIIPN